MYVFLNGDFKELKDALISPLDRGFLFGDGLFETIRIYNGKAFLLESHLKRLFSSASELFLELPTYNFVEIVEKLIEMNGILEGYLRITVSRGIHLGKLELYRDGNPTIFIFATTYSPPKDSFYEEGVSVSLFPYPMFSQMAKHKTTSYLFYLFVKDFAKKRGDFESVVRTPQGFLLEGASTNIFFAKDGILFTPSSELPMLCGITRKLVLELAKREGIEVVEGFFSLDEVLCADEIFLTNSMIELIPVSHFEGRTFSKEKRELFCKIKDLYKKEIESETNC